MKKYLLLLPVLFAVNAKVVCGSSSLDEYKGDWTETFQLSGGKIVHTPGSIGLYDSGSLKLSTTFLSLAPNSEFSFSTISPQGLHVTVDSTREEFIANLKKSGLYVGE